MQTSQQQKNSVMKLDYILGLADDALIISHRLGEWCGHGPILEQDIALTNTSLDHVGRARSLFQYAADIFNSLPEQDKKNYFSSVALLNIVNTGENLDEDDLAYLRDTGDFRNHLLVEQPNIDWAFTIARAFFYDTFNFYFFTELVKCKDETLAAIAAKSLKEVTYHLRWSSEWVIRLGDGTDESHERLQTAVNELWMYTGELFLVNESDKEMLENENGPDLVVLKNSWTERVKAIFEEATITIPSGKWMQQGGKEGRHSENLGYILADFELLSLLSFKPSI